MDIQALFPVYLAKREEQGLETPNEDYNADITANENNMNQNFTTLFNAITTLNEELTALRKDN